VKNRRNYYRILQVQPDAPAEVIRASYHTLMLELKQHPDLGGSTLQASWINEAYETLSNPQKRSEYDKKINVQVTRRSARTPEQDPPRCPFCKTRLAGKTHPGAICPICAIPLQSSKQPNPEQTSRRSLERRQKDDAILYSSSWPEEPQKGRMIDISPRGMRFIADENLKPGSILKISNPWLVASAIVANSQMKESQGRIQYAVGVSFRAVEFKEPKGLFISISG
jgi:curved DNA-binding protein CbpA